MSERFAFRMKLDPGQAAEYKKRHDELWPEMAKAIHDSGISDYTIWLDPETNYLFATLLRDRPADPNAPRTELNQRWWDFMADIMEVHPDNAPVQVPLVKVFDLP